MALDTLQCQLIKGQILRGWTNSLVPEDVFLLIVTPQGIEKVTIQLRDTPPKVYAIGAELFLSKVPLEVLQN